MFCTRCGKEIEITADSRFCPGCGLEYQWQPVETITPPPTPQEIVAKNHIQPIKYGNNNDPQAVLEKVGTRLDNEQKAGATVVAILLCILLVPLGIVAFLFFGSILLMIL